MKKSKRQIKRENRNFTESRPNRRAIKRLEQSLTNYKECVSRSRTGGIEFTKPGSMKRW